MTKTIDIRKFAAFAAIAAVLNSIIFLIGKAAKASMIVNQGGSREIILGMVFGSTFFGLLVAAFAANVIGEKFQSFLAKSPLIGFIFGLVTAAAPISAAKDSKTGIFLALMHLVAGITWFVGSKRSNR